MTHDELNQYILHYLTKDRTQSAIMLTGGWGTGKSYYIQNTLLPFLSNEENGNHQCIVVSLYGMQSTFEISKAIYLECRVKKLTGNSEKEVAGKLAARTVIKGITSYLGVDISKSEDEMRTLYESIDLSSKLIILEDIERSKIDIIEVLGYVNNLVEQDNVKVLLVINESALIKTEKVEEENIPGHKYTKTVFTAETRHYFSVKEKTVGDTIHFSDDFPTAVSQIVQSFNNETLTSILTRNGTSEIVAVLRKNRCNNLRSFIFCCQKTVDIFNKIDTSLVRKAEFCKTVFYGNLHFIMKRRSGSRESWGREEYLSVSLGNKNTPLFKFCYDYIVSQSLNPDDAIAAYSAWEEYKRYDSDKSNNDDDIKALTNYYTHTEAEIIHVLERVTERLRNDKHDFSFCVYGEIAASAILIKHNLGIEIGEIKNLLIENLRGLDGHVKPETLFRTDWDEKCDKSINTEYQELKSAMISSLKDIQSIIPGFSYQPEQSELLLHYVESNPYTFHDLRCFASCFDMNRLTKMYFQCSANGKDNIRMSFFKIYDSMGFSSYRSDKEAISLLLKLIQEQKPDRIGDKIQELQYTWFVDFLNSGNEKLEKY